MPAIRYLQMANIHPNTLFANDLFKQQESYQGQIPVSFWATTPGAAGGFYSPYISEIRRRSSVAVAGSSASSRRPSLSLLIVRT